MKKAKDSLLETCASVFTRGHADGSSGTVPTVVDDNKRGGSSSSGGDKEKPVPRLVMSQPVLIRLPSSATLISKG